MNTNATTAVRIRRGLCKPTPNLAENNNKDQMLCSKHERRAAVGMCTDDELGGEQQQGSDVLLTNTNALTAVGIRRGLCKPTPN